MNITDGYNNECYQIYAKEEGQTHLLVPFTGMMSEYLFEAVRLGFSAPFYHAETDIESLYYATAGRNEFSIHDWLRDNGGIDAWMYWTDYGLVPVCQINPRFDVDDQLHDMLANMRHLFNNRDLRYMGFRFQSLFKGHDFMVCQGDWVPDTSDKPQNFRHNCPSCDALYNDHMEDLYDAEMLRRAENEPFTLHDEFMTNDNKEKIMYNTNIVKTGFLSAYIAAAVDEHEEWFTKLSPEEAEWQAYQDSLSDETKEEYFLSMMLANMADCYLAYEEHVIDKHAWYPWFDGPVEGVDSHAYYGPMTTLTNFIEAQRDREFD